MKTSELQGTALDWAVCVANGETREEWLKLPYPYSTNWLFGGPIIEQEKIAVWYHSEYGCWCSAGIEWMDADVESDAFFEMPDAFRGPTPLIAAMRCYVASKLGDEIEIPEGLK